MRRLRRLRINKFRNVKPGTTLRLHDGVTAVIGKNASGKSTLLDLISMSLRSNFRSLRGEDFDLEYDMEHVHGDQRCTIHVHAGTRARQGTSSLMSTEIQEVRIFRAEVKVRTDNNEYTITQQGDIAQVEHQGKVIESDIGDATGTCEPFVWGFGPIAVSQKDQFRALFIGLFVESLAAAVRAFRFDEALHVFDSIVGSASSEPVTMAVYHADKKASSLLQVTADLITGFVPRPLRDLAEVRLRQRPDSSILEVDHDEVRFLGRAVKLFGYKSARMSLSLVRSTPPKNGASRAFFSRFRFVFTRRDRSTIHHELLSHGQKRLLALLYYLDANPHHVVADELASGLHFDWVSEVMKEVSKHQAFLASQNPMIFDHLRFDSAYETSRSFIICELFGEEMMWRNMGKDEATSLFGAYEEGRQRVGDLIRDKLM